jgi:hypothetical protein
MKTKKIIFLLVLLILLAITGYMLTGKADNQCISFCRETKTTITMHYVHAIEGIIKVNNTVVGDTLKLDIYTLTFIGSKPIEIDISNLKYLLVNDVLLCVDSINDCSSSSNTSLIHPWSN